MSFKIKLIHELKAIFWTTLYFLIWFGLLMLIKELLLKEYQIKFSGFSMVVVGALVAAKAVLILENVSMGSWTKRQPAIYEILFRTFLYLAGIFVIMVLEKAFEARSEFDGFINALQGVFGQVEFYHVLVNTICVFGALLGFNLWSVIRKHLGEGGMWKILSTPSTDENK